MDTITIGDKILCNNCEKKQVIGDMTVDFGGTTCWCKVCGKDMMV